MQSKPGTLQVVSIIWIIDGILTILWGFGLVLGALATLVGIICLPLAVYPFVVGIFELIYGIRLAGSAAALSKPPLFVSVMEILLLFWADPIGLIAGIVSLVLLTTPESKSYFSSQSASHDLISGP